MAKLKAWRKANPDKFNKYKETWRKKNRKKMAQATKRWNQNNPEKYAKSQKKALARQVIKRKYTKRPRVFTIRRSTSTLRSSQKRQNYRLRHPIKAWTERVFTLAIMSGRLCRKPCVVCGKAKSEGHHTNYRHPLHVVWLCRKHHMQAHNSPEKLPPPHAWNALALWVWACTAHHNRPISI